MRIVERIAKERLVEKMIQATGVKESQYNLDDLAQMIYMSLLEKDEDMLEKMDERGELKWFIQRMLTNNLFSKTSPFYKIIKHFDKITDDKKIKEGGYNLTID